MKGRSTAKLLAGLAALYVVSYASLSFTGGYRSLPTGHFRPFGLADFDALIWQPRWGECYTFRTATGDDTVVATPLGYLYRPLIALDQSYIHKKMQIFDAKGSLTTNVDHLSVSQYHPTERPVVALIKRIRGKYDSQLQDARARNDRAAVNELELQIVREFKAEEATK